MATTSDLEPPLPPKNSATWRAAKLPATTIEIREQSHTPASPFRLKKKVPWKGKNITVLLPTDDARDHRCKALAPLADNHLSSMRYWEQFGYTINGFNLADQVCDEDAREGQSRSIWPSTADVNFDRAHGAFRISIPNRGQWDAYVQELKGAKLRALGVKYGDKKPAPTMLPSVSSVSHRTSMQYTALPISPPIPTYSAASSHSNQANPFSPQIPTVPGLSTSRSSNAGSATQPASVQSHVKPDLGVSRSIMGDQPLAPPFQYPQQQSSGFWSLHDSIERRDHTHGGPSTLHHLDARTSPDFSSRDYMCPPQPSNASQIQQRRRLLQPRLHMPSSARDSPHLAEFQEVNVVSTDENMSRIPTKTREARTGIRPNFSTSLQGEIAGAEYHLEEQFQRQVEHKDYSPDSYKQVDQGKSSDASGIAVLSSQHAGDSQIPVLYHPQPHSAGHSLIKRPFQGSKDSAPDSNSQPALRKDRKRFNDSTSSRDLPGIKTKISSPSTSTLEKNSSRHKGTLSAPSKISRAEERHGSRRAAHGARPSISKLDVTAKEFQFDPTNLLQPSQFAFNSGNSQNRLQSPVANYASDRFIRHLPFGSNHLSPVSMGSFNGKPDLAAAPFNPGQSEFNFSMSGPKFRPNATTFTPSCTEFLGSGIENPHKTTMFGNIFFNESGKSKPAKKSKAVPIIHPDYGYSSKIENETMEGKDGRITQGEGRIKRARGGKDTRDCVALFAESRMPLGQPSIVQSPQKDSRQSTRTTDKENADPEDAIEMDRSRGNMGRSSVGSVHEWAPFEFQKQSQAEEFNAGRPCTFRRYASGSPGCDYPAVPQGHTSPREEAFVTSSNSIYSRNKKTASNLSATAKSFEFKPAAFNSMVGESSSTILASARISGTQGLATSMFARESTLDEYPSFPEDTLQPDEVVQFQASLPGPETALQSVYHEDAKTTHESTFEGIDSDERHLNKHELGSSTNREPNKPKWHQLSPTRPMQLADSESSLPDQLLPPDIMRSNATSPAIPNPIPVPSDTTEMNSSHKQDDPFINKPQSKNLTSPVRRLNRTETPPASDWDDMISESENIKLQNRLHFLDGRFNELVDGLLARRLQPLEKSLEAVQMSLKIMAVNDPSSRRGHDRRSICGALSDADDEEDESTYRKTLCPKRDRKLEKIRAIITEALAAHQPLRPESAMYAVKSGSFDEKNVLDVLKDLKQQFSQSMRLAEQDRNVVENAVISRLPISSKCVSNTAADEGAAYHACIADSEEPLRISEQIAEIELLELRDAEEDRAEIERLQNSPMMGSTRLRHWTVAQVSDIEDENGNRRAAEYRLAEVPRSLRRSSENEGRLPHPIEAQRIETPKIVDARELRSRVLEKVRAKTTMGISSLEVTQDYAHKVQNDTSNRLATYENQLREARQEICRLQSEVERTMQATRRHSDDAEVASDANKQLRRALESASSQLEESTRVREGIRGKLMDLQKDMAEAVKNISKENAKSARREQELVARQEVLDARLQAEARCREGREQEIARLEKREREGMRAIHDCKRLEDLVGELRRESQISRSDALRCQKEYEEAREAGLSEVQRTRKYFQHEVEAANSQVNAVREHLETQMSRLRGEVDQVRLEADTARVRYEMLLEEATTSKDTSLKELTMRHANEKEEFETQVERQLGNATEDAQRSEQHLLERLSLSAAKTEHLQDRISYLEEKLEIAKSAGNAAAEAEGNGAEPIPKTLHTASVGEVAQLTQVQKSISGAMKLPEKVSPQALRESVMVLQEQLQDREQKIEMLEQTLSTTDVDAPTKIAKRDDEIVWLRELLAVRKGDLQDIVSTLSSDVYDQASVKDTAIRLRANLQMEEQERDRAMNGGLSINLPNLATSVRDVATPRFAQAVGPLAAAWGNWRKSKDANINPTPVRTNSSSQQNFLAGLLTPPTSSIRTPARTTGKRFTPAQLANRPRTGTPRKAENMPMGNSPRRAQGALSLDLDRPAEPPSTPPMMRKSSYDLDAKEGSFSDAGISNEDETTANDSLYGAANFGR